MGIDDVEIFRRDIVEDVGVEAGDRFDIFEELVPVLEVDCGSHVVEIFACCVEKIVRLVAALHLSEPVNKSVSSFINIVAFQIRVILNRLVRSDNVKVESGRI